MSDFHILKGRRVVATADTLAEAQAFAKKAGARVLQVPSRANPSSGAKQRARGTREDTGEGAEASLGWAAHYREAAKRYKADPSEGDAAAAIAHHKQEIEAIRQRFPASRLPGARKNPSAATHAEIAKTDIREARDRTGKAKAQTDTTSRREAAHTAIASALLAIREAKHSGNLKLLKQALAAEDEAFEALIGPQVRHNGADGSHPAEAWVRSKRKPAIDFGELGIDRQVLAKWLGEHPGKTAAFKAAGTVYHSANIGGQVFTVPAMRKNGTAALQREWMEAKERKNYAWDQIAAIELTGKPVPKSAMDAYNSAWREWVEIDRRYEAESAYKPRKAK